MGTRSGIKVRARVPAGWPALPLAVAGAFLALAVAPRAATATLCPAGRQFWDAARGRCRDCSTCTEPGHIVLRPCHVHQDTVCGPMHRLDVEGAWSRALGEALPSADVAATTPTTTAAASTTTRPSRQRDHRNKHGHQHGHQRAGASELPETSEETGANVVHGAEEATSTRRVHKHSHHSNSSSGHEHTKHRQKLIRDQELHRSRKQHSHNHTHSQPHSNHPHPHQQAQLQRVHHHHHHHHRPKARPPESAAQLLVAEAESAAETTTSQRPPPPGAGAGAETPAPPRAPRPPEPFSAVEAFAWDWQAAALVAAVAGCALFFGAAALHGIRQVRKDASRSADADSLSATLSLMVQEIANDIPENCPTESCNSNQCLYMEQLLVRKNEELNEGQGNVYIDRGNSKINV